MRGGKRPGAGRKKGPEKKRLVALVLPATSDALNKQALFRPSLGVVIDEMVAELNKPKISNKK